VGGKLIVVGLVGLAAYLIFGGKAGAKEPSASTQPAKGGPSVTPGPCTVAYVNGRAIYSSGGQQVEAVNCPGIGASSPNASPGSGTFAPVTGALGNLWSGVSSLIGTSSPEAH